MRKARFFQRDAYVSVDFLNKKTEVAFLKSLNGGEVNPFLPILEPGNGREAKQVHFERPAIVPTNAILAELSSFANAIISNTTPDVTISDGYKALKVAHQILAEVESAISKHNPF